jgi:hypothetical protein
MTNLTLVARALERRGVLVVTLLALTAVAYINTLPNGFVWDDFLVLVDNDAVKDLSNLPRFFSEPSTSANSPALNHYRPLRTTVYSLAFQFFGSRPLGYHVLNLLLHMANVMLVLLLVSRLGSRPLVAGLVAAVFAVHPLTTEVVASVTGLGDLLFAFFYLVALLMHIGYVTGPRKGWLRLALVYGAFMLSLLSKELALSLPLAVLLVDLLLARTEGRKRTGLDYAVYVSGLFGVAAGYLLIRGTLLGGLAPGEYPGVTLLRTMAMQLVVLARYLQLIILPIGQSIRHVVPVPESYFEPLVVFSFLLVGGVAVLGVWSVKRDPHVSFGVGWFFVTLLPVMNIVPLPGSMMGERFCYLPLIGIVYAAAQFLPEKSPGISGSRAGIVSWLAVVAVLSVFLIMTVRRNRDWRDNLTIFESAVKVSPGSNAVRLMLAGEYERLGRTQDARRQVAAAAANTSEYLVQYNRMGDRAFQAANWKEARTWYMKALKMNASDYHARARLAELDERTSGG